jgi:hypothetical protein
VPVCGTIFFTLFLFVIITDIISASASETCKYFLRWMTFDWYGRSIDAIKLFTRWPVCEMALSNYDLSVEVYFQTNIVSCSS